MGGFVGPYSDVLASAEIYDPAAGTFSLTSNAAAKRSYNTATLLADGTVLVVGGSRLWGFEIYDPVTATWR
jgi:hypothetical protein